MAKRRFAPFGLACVVTLAVTALFQGQTIIGGWEELWRTEYGLWAVVKIVLFALLLVFAAANQFLLAGPSSASASPLRRRPVCWSSWPPPYW